MHGEGKMMMIRGEHCRVWDICYVVSKRWRRYWGEVQRRSGYLRARNHDNGIVIVCSTPNWCIDFPWCRSITLCPSSTFTITCTNEGPHASGTTVTIKNQSTKIDDFYRTDLIENCCNTSQSNCSYFSVVVVEPEFTDVIENITVPAGRNVKFSCSVKNLGTYKVSKHAYRVKSVLIELPKPLLLRRNTHMAG